MDIVGKVVLQVGEYVVMFCWGQQLYLLVGVVYVIGDWGQVGFVEVCCVVRIVVVVEGE